MRALQRCIRAIWCLYIAVLHMALSLCVRSSVTAACRCSIGFCCHYGPVDVSAAGRFPSDVEGVLTSHPVMRLTLSVLLQLVTAI